MRDIVAIPETDRTARRAGRDDLVLVIHRVVRIGQDQVARPSRARAMRLSSAVGSAPAARSDQDSDPARQHRGHSQLCPMLPWPSAWRSGSTIGSPGSLTFVIDGSSAPSSASARHSTSCGPPAAAPHSMALAAVCAGVTKPAPSRALAGNVTASPSSVPAAYSSAPSAARTGPPRTVLAGIVAARPASPPPAGAVRRPR